MKKKTKKHRTYFSGLLRGSYVCVGYVIVTFSTFIAAKSYIVYFGKRFSLNEYFIFNIVVTFALIFHQFFLFLLRISTYPNTDSKCE